MKPNYRRCVSCKKLAPKEEFWRVVRSKKSDTIKLDIITNLNKNYWKVVNKASRWTFKASYAAISKWVKIKGINISSF